MRICSTCHQQKLFEEFGWKDKAKTRQCSVCRDCMRLYIREHYKNNVDYYVKKALRRKKLYRRETYQKIINYFSNHPCVDCGEGDPLVLEFDHVGKGTKIAAISEMVKYQRPWNVILREIKKCEVRCANCHRRKTARQRRYLPYLIATQEVEH